MDDFADDLSIDIDTYVFTFGQYKGVAYSDVKNDDPGYILWCMDNMDWFKISYDEKQELLALTEDINIDNTFSKTVSKHVKKMVKDVDVFDWNDDYTSWEEEPF